MTRAMWTVEETAKAIKDGKVLLIAGDDALLKALPTGKWIAGTIPYFMGDEGGLATRDQLAVTELPSFVKDARIVHYDADTVANVYKDANTNGFSAIIIPAMSTTHVRFAVEAPTYESFALRPLIGWIAGVHLDELGTTKPRVYCGATGRSHEEGAVVMHVELPDDKVAEINVVNIFEPGSGATITFPKPGFSVETALVDGQERSFAEYLTEIQADTRFPLVASYYGAIVNTSFQNVSPEKGIVDLYAPVFAGVEYRLARPVSDYVKDFGTHMPTDPIGLTFSCNCILNYLHSKLEGRQTGGFRGPITFGEVAYQLVNQTLAYLVISDG